VHLKTIMETAYDRLAKQAGEHFRKRNIPVW